MSGVERIRNIQCYSCLLTTQTDLVDCCKEAHKFTCKICRDKFIGVVFLPCGHLAACTTCGASIATCPICRESIKSVVRTFLS